MAVIEGATTGALCEVDLTSKGQWVTTLPKNVTGAFGTGAVTGVLPAALASGSVLWAIRNGPTANTDRIIITRLYSKFYARTVASVFTDVSLELVRFSGANLSGGVAGTIANKRPNGVAAVNSAALAGGPQGGDLRIATTAGLTTTGATFDTTSTHTFLYIPVISAASPAVGTAFERSVENDSGYEHPFELVAGEGLAIRTVGAIPTGLTLQGHIQASWSERK